MGDVLTPQINTLIDILDNALLLNTIIMLLIFMTFGFFLFESISRSNLLNFKDGESLSKIPL